MSAAAVAPAQTTPSNGSTTTSPSVVLTKTEEVDKKPASVSTKTTNCASSSTTSNTAETKDAAAASKAPTEDALPADLSMILKEVAKTGKCPWLSWNGKDPPEAPMPPDMQAAVCNNSQISVASSKASNTSSRSVLAKHRSTTSAFSSLSSKKSGAPARKKLRNGVNRRARYSSGGESTSNTTEKTASGRKRPLYLTRTPSATGSTFSASSIGSGRTSGSEVEDSTQYECDSEGTSATTNSEVSVASERRAARKKRIIIQTLPGSTFIHSNQTNAGTCRYKTLRGALRAALSLVLDCTYRTRGGYKLSPAELRIHAAAVAAQSAASNAMNGGSEKENSPELEVEPPSPEKTFQQRKRRLLALLGEDSADAPDSVAHSPLHHQATVAAGPSYLGGASSEFQEGPPFTIQRIAEVLVAPERYYKQTHKLCNCLEKLLLVTSPASSFGGDNGGALPQSKVGDNELTVALDKKGRQDVELRSNKRLKRRMSSSDASDDEGAHNKTLAPHEKSTDELTSSTLLPGSEDTKGENQGDKEDDRTTPSNGSEMSSKEILEAAARAQLRSKFDHVGIDPHSSSAVDRSVPGIPNRGMTSSPPPPGLANGAAALSPHGAVSGFVRHVGGEHSPGGSAGDACGDSSVPHPSTVQQNPTPFFSAANENATHVPAVHANQSIQMLQMHHEAALSGTSDGDATAAAAVNNPPLELVVGGPPGAAAGAGLAASSSAEAADLDVEQPQSGRSSASNSDVEDSESDDFYMDDSASDRSDGSDHCEPFTAARVMALNRIAQQQQRRGTTLHYQHGLGFRPPLDTEYQSGDSIDSTMAEDSCGSDSSSASDLAD